MLKGWSLMGDAVSHAVLTGFDGQAKAIYRAKDGCTSKTFEALDWLAQLVTQIPNKGEQMVRYYGSYLHRKYKKKKGSQCLVQI